MANYAYERLGAEDASFLLFEDANTHMHVSWTWIFDAGPLARPDGGVDIERIRRYVGARLYRFPRFRQRIARVPMDGHPVWVDDENFKLHYHVRHTSLPEPGDMRQLQTETATIIAQPLDRSKPLWELWIVEELEGGRFAVVSKTHHCMVDGISTVDLMTGLLDDQPTVGSEEAPDWIPRPAPSRTDLFRDGMIDRATIGVRALGHSLDTCAQLARSGPGDLLRSARSIAARAPKTPLNQPIGPHRLVHWRRFESDMLRTIAKRLGGTVNDVVLTIVAGALRRFLDRRPGDPSAGPLRVALPAHTAPPVTRGAVGNRAAAFVLALPVHLDTPAERFEAIKTATASLAERPDHADSGRWLSVAEALGGAPLAIAVWARQRMYSYNLVVTSIPGPRQPRFLLGAPLREAYPHIPLFHNQALSIATASYCGGIHVGLTANWEVIPTIEELGDDLATALVELRAIAPVRLSVVDS